MRGHIPDTGKMVPDAWMEAADRVLVPGKPMTTSDLRNALAAVAPLIAAAERERCARLAEDRHLGWIFPHPDDARPGEVCDDATACADIAAAIRAMGNADE